MKVLFVTDHKRWVPSLRCKTVAVTDLTRVSTVENFDLVVVLKTCKHKLSLPYTNAASKTGTPYAVSNTGAKRIYANVENQTGIDLSIWGGRFWTRPVGINLINQSVDIAMAEETTKGRDYMVKMAFSRLGGDARKAPKWKNMYDTIAKYHPDVVEKLKPYLMKRGVRTETSPAADISSMYADPIGLVDNLPHPPDKDLGNGHIDSLKLLLSHVMVLMKDHNINGITLVAGEKPLVNRTQM